MKRVTFVISSLTSGGAERVMTTMANHWAERDWPVTLITVSGGEDFFPLHSNVRRVRLDAARVSGSPIAAIRNNVTRLTSLRTTIRASHPDVVISFLDTTNVLTLLATRTLGLPVIVEEHTDPAQKRLSGPWRWLRSALYPRAARIVVLSEASRSYFPDRLHGRIDIVPNPVVPPPQNEARPSPSGNTVIALGRLGPEKGFDLLLEAWARLTPRFPDWRLVIWGEGSVRADLEALRSELGLDESVTLPGRTADPVKELRRADIFVMSSRREGFPMALAEAMACGLPVVSADCPSGPRQLIRPGVDGLLVPAEDPVALADALATLISDPVMRTELATRAPEVLERFGVERVMRRWEELLDVVCSTGEPDRFRTIRPDRSKPATGGAD